MTLHRTPAGVDGDGALARSFYTSDSPDLLDRWSPVADWVWSQVDAGLLVQPRVAAGPPGPRAAGLDASGRDLSGADFARRDHLNLSSRPEVIAAAKEALDSFGPHAAGPAASTGLTRLTLALETRIAEYLSLAHAVMFPDGWSAAMATLRALVRPGDRVLVGPRAPGGVLDGAALAGAAVLRREVLSPAAVEVALSEARAEAPASGLLVALSALDDGRGAVADLPALQAVCNRHRATLMVDLTGDLGLLGPSGRGLAEVQGVLGAIDVVTGCLTPVFASSAGFAASGNAAFKDALRYGGGPRAAAPALAPVEAAAALAALDLIETEAGARARIEALGNANWLGAALRAKGFVVDPGAAASVTVRLGAAGMARRMTAAMQEAGVVVHLDEPEEGDAQRFSWVFHVMAAHGPADLSAAVAAAVEARRRATDPGWTPSALCNV